MSYGVGFGGGSGNAATTFFVANKLCGLLVMEVELLEWSGEIGSDILVFFFKGVVYCMGRGEIVEDVESSLDLVTKMLFVKSSMGCSMLVIFKVFDFDGCLKVDLLELLKCIGVDGCLEMVCINDFEVFAFTVLFEFVEFKERFKAATVDKKMVVFMFGSGSMIVIVGDDDVFVFVV